MNPFDQSPSTPPVSLDPRPEPPKQTGRGRLVVAGLASVGVLGAAVFGISQLVTADEPELVVEASAASTTGSPGDDLDGLFGSDGLGDVLACFGSVIGGDQPGVDGAPESDGAPDSDGAPESDGAPDSDSAPDPDALPDGDLERSLDELLDGRSLDEVLEEFMGDESLEGLFDEFLDGELLDRLLEGLPDDQSLQGLTGAASAQPDDESVPEFGDLLGDGVYITVVGPDGISVVEIGDGDGSITISKDDGDVMITSEGDATVAEMSDLLGELGEAFPDLDEGGSLPFDPEDLPDDLQEALDEWLPGFDLDAVQSCLEEALGN